MNDDNRTHDASSAVNDEDLQALADGMTAQGEQFQKLANLARKATEDHITKFVAGAIAPLLDSYNISFAVLCGVTAGAVTSLVGLGDSVGDDATEQQTELLKLMEQMNGVFHQIQQRKALLAATDLSEQ